jgi:hypothetical protein
MTAPAMIPQDPGQPGPDPAALPSQGNGEASPPSDYLARAARDPDFARSELQKHQSRADRAEAVLRRLGPLREVVEQAGGDEILRVLQQHQQIVADPRLREVVTTFLSTGQVNLPARPPSIEQPHGNGQGEIDEDLLTPFEKHLLAAVTNLTKRQDAIDGRFQTHEVSAGQSALTRHLEQFFQELPLSAPIAEKVKRGMAENVRRYSLQGEEGRKAIDNLLSAQGYQTVKALAMSSLNLDEIEEAIGRRRANLRGGLRTLATDGPPRPAGGRELPDTRGMTALQALELARSQPDLIESQE